MSGYKEKLQALSSDLSNRWVSLFSWKSYAEYLSEGVQTLLDDYPYLGLQTESDLELDSLKEVVNTYQSYFFLKRFWLRLTTSVGVYLGLYELKVVNGLSDCLEDEDRDKRKSYRSAQDLYQEHRSNLMPSLIGELVGDWRYQLGKLQRSLWFDWCDLPSEFFIPPLETILSSLEEELGKEGSYDLERLLKDYERLREAYPAYDKPLLVKLERRICLKLHPDKNPQQYSQAEEAFKRFGLIRENADSVDLAKTELSREFAALKEEIQQLAAEWERKIATDKAESERRVAELERKIAMNKEELERKAAMNKEELREEFKKLLRESYSSALPSQSFYAQRSPNTPATASSSSSADAVNEEELTTFGFEG